VSAAPGALGPLLEAVRADVEAALDGWLPPAAGDPTRLHEAMRYSALDGGKRVRPALCLFAAEALGATRLRALPAACALELIHVYSLVHDDLPAMDDDDLRRGRPTSHKVFGEATAILVGDGLQALAFEVLARAYADDPALGLDLVRLLAVAAGAPGMVGGQALDMAAAGREDARTEAALEELHRKKTGALLRASVLLGARVGGAREGEGRFVALDAYARALGLAFQVVDDVLDVTATTAQLGKTAGKDVAQDKLTYVALLGLDGARAKAARLEAEALAAVADLGPAAEPLRALARYVVSRGS
jgi:geranylgeranyl diphosphate synthase type II